MSHNIIHKFYIETKLVINRMQYIKLFWFEQRYLEIKSAMGYSYSFLFELTQMINMS